jgi:hypothetical protein
MTGKLIAPSWAGMDDQIAIGAAGDLHLIVGEAELGRDAHGLAVAVHAHPAGKYVDGFRQTDAEGVAVPTMNRTDSCQGPILSTSRSQP